jgi:AbrB family looped-hinge helix DNA binding protein
MKITVGKNGRIVLPGSICQKAGIRPGDVLDIKAEAGRIVLTPRLARSHKVRILIGPITGLPVLSAGPDASPLTSGEVHEILFGAP